MANSECQARYEQGGSMRCSRCGFVWDYDDPEPPSCLTDNDLKAAEHQRGRVALDRIKKSLE
jgi:hypothetical protein